ncbi:hypothetical protein NA57DRAFT_72196 [Rhizodiscina lignyota]|uniref:Uncharacterized protein n=1 Tax=Rhizodiscina lignyota TaxID=1504668 RepID=A0A9P4IS07_9PEZI|nr:hypothetical protein NA57DRAFT_72196 [Rhizodiscina lignyota]
MIFNVAFGAAALLVSGALAAESCETCYTKTVTATGVFKCPVEPSCPPLVADCILVETTYVPDKVCPTTATVPPCKTTCQTGCATSTMTVVDRTDNGCFTATITPPITCPLEPVSATLHCSEAPVGPVCPDIKDVTVTRPPHNPYCPNTPTVTAKATCPNDCGCPAIPTITVTAK